MSSHPRISFEKMPRCSNRCGARYCRPTTMINEMYRNLGRSTSPSLASRHRRIVWRLLRTIALMEVTVMLLALVAAAAAASPYRVTTDAECEAYLCKYGYTYSLGCACPPAMAADTRVMPSAQWRQEHAAQSDDASRGSSASSSMNSAADLRPCVAAEFAAALAVFQRTNRLAVTGTCDSDTRTIMSSARCGVVDDYGAKVASAAATDAVHGPGGPTTPAPRNVLLAGEGSGGGDSESGGEDAQPLVISDPVAESNKKPVHAAYDRPQEARGRLRVSAIAGTPLLRTTQQSMNVASVKNWLSANLASVARKRLLGKHQLDSSRTISDGGKAPLEVVGGSGSGHRTLQRRSTEVATAAAAGPWVNRTKPIRWRIVRYASQPSVSDQDGAIEQAFRKWAAVTPLCFVRDVTSDVRKLDVVIGFYDGPHGGDFRQFDGYGGEIAHSYPMQFTHFDAAESWTVGGPGSSTGYNLLAAAIHEFGHLLGLSNSPSDNSAMNSLYTDRRRLSDEDVAAAAALYGQCSGRFDAVVDVLFSEDDLDDSGFVVTRRYFSTMFFRGSINWLYKHGRKRPMEGEPMAISSSFSGLPNSLDAVVQYCQRRAADGSYVDILFAFKGSHVYVYDYRGRRVLRSGSISGFFPSGSSRQPIPNNLDSAYFDPRDGNIYFFKDDLVYAYHFQPDGQHSCCEFIRPIVDVFPPARSNDIAQPPHYRKNIDAAYMSIRDESLYIIKGEDVWVTGGVRVGGTPLANVMRYDGLWNQRWRYICETDC